MTVHEGKQDVTGLDEIIGEQGRSSEAEYNKEEPNLHRQDRYIKPFGQIRKSIYTE